MKRALISTIVMLLVLGAAQNLAAQKKGGTVLSGVVLGPDDKPVADAIVTYQSAAGMAPHAVHTDAQGRFTITKLRSNDIYDLRASGEGVFSEWEKNVTVRFDTRALNAFAFFVSEAGPRSLFFLFCLMKSSEATRLNIGFLSFLANSYSISV